MGGVNLLIGDIVIGDNIEVEVKIQGHTMSFTSQVVMIIDDILLISPIKSDDQTVGFSENCVVSVLYNLNGRIYRWKDIDLKLIKYDGLIYHSTVLEGKGQPYNRRNAYRLYLGMEMLLYYNSSQGPAAISVNVKDISELGVSFITNEELELNRRFHLSFRDGTTRLNLEGSIIRMEYMQHLGSYVYGCKFYDKNYLLSKYIARKQGEILRQKNTTYNAFPVNDLAK